LPVMDPRTGKPAGIITETDVAHAIADGKDVNDVRVAAVMATRPAVRTTTSVHDVAKIMTARQFRHLPVAGDTGLLGLVDIIDVCRAWITASQRLAEPEADPGGAAGPGCCARDRRPASAQGQGNGVQGQPHARSHHGAIDADVLQIAPEEQFQLTRRLRGIPSLDGPGDKAGEFVVE